MNYYEETLERIRQAIDEGNIKEASFLLETEKRMPYVPQDFLFKLNELETCINIQNDRPNGLSDEKINEYLNGNMDCQTAAVYALLDKNLRDEIDICNQYLSNPDADDRLKSVLIYGLIQQEIGSEMHCLKDGLEFSFTPKYCLLPSESDGYIRAKEIIADATFKNPSANAIAMELLNEEALRYLPFQLEEEEGMPVAEKILSLIQNLL